MRIIISCPDGDGRDQPTKSSEHQIIYRSHSVQKFQHIRWKNICLDENGRDIHQTLSAHQIKLMRHSKALEEIEGTSPNNRAHQIKMLKQKIEEPSTVVMDQIEAMILENVTD